MFLISVSGVLAMHHETSPHLGLLIDLITRSRHSVKQVFVCLCSHVWGANWHIHQLHLFKTKYDPESNQYKTCELHSISLNKTKSVQSCWLQCETVLDTAVLYCSIAKELNATMLTITMLTCWCLSDIYDVIIIV